MASITDFDRALDLNTTKTDIITHIVSLPSTPPLSNTASPDPVSPIERDDVLHFQELLAELTIEEKVSLLSGTSFTTTAGVDRLEIPALKVSDSINGVRGSNSHLEDQGTACFPSSTCLAATWNEKLMRELGVEVGIQAKLKSVQVVVGPNINIHRDPRGGRNFETFSEDPLLTGKLAAAIVTGIQSQGVGACVKHFAGNESETKRRTYNVAESAGGRTMREIYMKAFQYLLQGSNPASIMMASVISHEYRLRALLTGISSYNKLDGIFCSQTPLIKSLLRKNWNYQGCIMSDWYGTHSGAEALKAGLDLEMPGPSVFRGKKLLEALEDGSVTEADIDEATLNVLTLIGQTAESHSSKAEKVVVCDRTSMMARRVASEGIVLLKNEKEVLPIDMRRAPKIAVIGAAAETPSVSGGGSAYATPQYIQRPYDCLRDAHPVPSIVRYAQGVNSNHTVPIVAQEKIVASSGENGVDIKYYNDGRPSPVFEEISPVPQVVMLGFVKPGLDRNAFNYEIKTRLTPRTTGWHTIGCQITGDFSLYVDDQKILAGSAPDITVEDFLFVPKKLERCTTFHMVGGRSYSVRLAVHSRDSAYSTGEISPHAAKLCFEEAYSDGAAIAEAVDLAYHSDYTIIFGGRTHEHESEGFDMDTIKLPQNQLRMIKAVSSVSAKTVLVLHGGNPIDVSDIVDDVDAVLAAHFPGQEGAQAITDIITGKTNPSGKLATSWPLRLECTPSFGNFPAVDDGDGFQIEYAEGLRLGYRHPDAASNNRWCFGHGLSYTTFAHSDLTVVLSLDQAQIEVSVAVRNTGMYPGHEVVQLYVRASQGRRVWRPDAELKAFDKVWLLSGESKSIRMVLSRRDVCSYWDETGLEWHSEAGVYEFTAGRCRRELEISRDERWSGLS